MSPNESDETLEGDSNLVELASRIADATQVDWPDPKNGSQAGTLAGLRVLAALADAHRLAAIDAEAVSGGPAAHGPTLFQWGGLAVLVRIGRGSFGEVFRAHDSALGRDVALKLRHAEAGSASSAARWIEEARRLARIRHPNVLTVFGAGVFDGRAGLWTELVQGETLESRLARLGPLGAREAASIGLDLCAALAAVHAEGLVHGDLKAANVMREGGADSIGKPASGRIVLMDFGSAHEQRLDEPATWTLGTPLVSAPEVVAGGRPRTNSDLYSLGVLLFRLVTGRYPVEALTLGELRSRHERGERSSLRALRPDLPARFVLAVERSLEPDPARRFADTGAMERSLAECLTVTAASNARDARRTRGARAWLIAAVAAAVIGVIATMTLRSRREPATPIGGMTLGSRTGAGSSAPTANPAPPPATSAARLPGAPAASGAAGAASAVVPSTALAVNATLLRGTGSGAVPLSNGGRVTTGDHLFLEIETPDPAWIYVLDEDGTGATVVLFPVSGTDLANPLAGGVNHRLPGRIDNRPFDWQVTSAGGGETFLIVASRHPLPAIEQQVGELDHAAPGHEVTYASLGPEALDGLRGVAGLTPAPAGASSASDSQLRAIARRLSVQPRHDLWVRLIEVANPGP